MAFWNTFKNKTVLVTGHTGFKGSWLVAWLRELGAQITGLSLNVPTVPSHFEALKISDQINDIRIDLCEHEEVRRIVVDQQPDYVFHLAAQSLVQTSYNEPISTYRTNVFGTLSLLEAIRGLRKPCVAVFITSDKCYNNVEWTWGYREIDALGGSDPYSGSKAAAEMVIQAHVKSFFDGNSSLARIGVGRAGNVIGGGDWASNRVVPDCMRAWNKGDEAVLHNPDSTRPWQHVLEPLSGYLMLADRLKKKCRTPWGGIQFRAAVRKR